MANLSNQEKLVDRYIQEEKTEAAVQLLFQLIVLHAKEKNFEKAEELRRKLLQTDSMALKEIIKSAEIIEEEKSGSLDHSHRAIWSKLYDTLTLEESNAFFYAMKDVNYGVDEVIFKQDGMNSNLYFIDQGELKLVYRREDTENLLKTLYPGDIAGHDTFFAISFSTTSLITLSSAKVKILNRAVIAEWEKDHPSLMPKLFEYCNSLESINELLKKKGQDRRTNKRIKKPGKAAIQLLNPSGNPTGNPFRGAIFDISAGGLSLALKIPTEETARLLLGRKMKVELFFSDSTLECPVKQVGTIISVSSHVLTSYILHLKFDAILKEKEMICIARD